MNRSLHFSNSSERFHDRQEIDVDEVRRNESVRHVEVMEIINALR